jgi:hypothetical protein
MINRSIPLRPCTSRKLFRHSDPHLQDVSSRVKGPETKPRPFDGASLFLLEKSRLRRFFQTAASLSPAKDVAFVGCVVATLRGAFFRQQLRCRRQKAWLLPAAL